MPEQLFKCVDSQRSAMRLPRTLSSLETWGFGLTGHVGWISTAPLIHAALGAKAILIWLPGVIVSVLLNLQVQRLGRHWSDVAGGTPNYAARLLSKFPVLVDELQITANSRAITFVSHSDRLHAYLDEKLLRHILSNLLSNAIKYSPEGSNVSFTLNCEQGKIIFRVQDRGIGIPAADQAQLFDTFHRASNVGTISGTGLGLAIVKKAVDLQHGQITFESEVGVGTTFIVSLPLQPEDYSDHWSLITDN